ncbi:hypothetical protein KUCAC02_012390, partial [Chaenocephalus aceratus]
KGNMSHQPPIMKRTRDKTWKINSVSAHRCHHHPLLPPMGESQTIEDTAKGVKIQWGETQSGTSGRAAGAKVN